MTWSLTSLERAGPEELLELVRNHWHLTCATSPTTKNAGPTCVFACLTNAAIAIVRCDGRFRYLPEANRHYAARAQEALDAIMTAPIAWAASPPDRDVPPSGAGGPVCLSNPKTPPVASSSPHDVVSSGLHRVHRARSHSSRTLNRD